MPVAFSTQKQESRRALPSAGRRYATGSSGRKKEQGYILMTLLLFVALLAIAGTAAIERVDMQIRRDREEEMIHRGVQYARAIRHYVKKFGRYPTSVEELEDTNNLRFLRRRYKDPITGKDFKLLHMGDIQSALTPGLAGATPAGNMTAAAGQGQQGFMQSSPQSGFGQTSPSGNFGAGSSAAESQNSGPQNSGSQNSNSQNSGADQNGAGDHSSSDSTNGQSGSAGGFQPGSVSGQVFGGGPIVGVASLSKAKSIRVFNNKDHYNQWLFIYDPTTDRGGLINTPYQPGVAGGVGPGQMGIPTGVQGIPGAPPPTAAPNPGFGNPATGFGNSGSSPQQPQNPSMPQSPSPF